MDGEAGRVLSHGLSLAFRAPWGCKCHQLHAGDLLQRHAAQYRHGQSRKRRSASTVPDAIAAWAQSEGVAAPSRGPAPDAVRYP
jgi:hypothetical protein